MFLNAQAGHCLSTPAGTLHGAVDEIMTILKDARLKQAENCQDRKHLILTVVRHHFDFEEMSKLTLAAHWKNISDQEKEHFVSLFSQLIENSYINKIEAYSNEEIVFLRESVRAEKSLVPTIIKHNNVDIPINYKLFKQEDSWRVYDVVIEGVSLVQNYRTQFHSIISKEKYAGLVKRIEEKLEKIKTKEGE